MASLERIMVRTLQSRESFEPLYDYGQIHPAHRQASIFAPVGGSASFRGIKFTNLNVMMLTVEVQLLLSPPPPQICLFPLAHHLPSCVSPPANPLFTQRLGNNIHCRMELLDGLRIRNAQQKRHNLLAAADGSVGKNALGSSGDDSS